MMISISAAPVAMNSAISHLPSAREASVRMAPSASRSARPSQSFLSLSRFIGLKPQFYVYSETALEWASTFAPGKFMSRKSLCLFALTLCAPILFEFTAPQGLAQSAAPQMLFEHNVAMKTRDGVTLKADIYRPAGEGPFPVLLQRTPYNKDGAFDFALKAVVRGFMVVVQDVRGRYTSDGEWYTFKHEMDDGYDTVEWAAALPHSNGKVGMFGGS